MSLGCSDHCRDIVIFNLLGCRPPASWISLDLCNGPNSHEGRTASPCQISSKSLKPQLRYGYFSIFKMAAAAILDFWNFKFLTVETVKSVELHLLAKFRRNRSNRGWDITIFRFFQDGGRPPSWICNACVGTTHEVCGDHPRRAFGSLYHGAKFGWNRCSSFENMHVFRFREFGLKTPIHAQNWWFLGGK